MSACYGSGAQGLLAPLKEFMEDERISEILINKPQEVFVEEDGSMRQIEMPMLTSLYLRRLFTLIANENRQCLSEESPILSGNLFDGSRVQLVIPPVSQHETLSIRKFTLKNLNFDDYEHYGFFAETPPNYRGATAVSSQTLQNLQTLYKTKQWQAFIQQAIHHKKNILISGGTSSGKTTFLNACIQQIPRDARLIILEDTFEVQVPQANHVRLKAFKQVGDKTARVAMQDLVQASLRLRPDRLIMGEIRGREIFDFVAACSTGHAGSLATIHANSPKVAFMRMAQLYKLNPVSNMNENDIYNILHEVIDVIVQVAKTSEGRRLVEVYYKEAK